MPSPDDVLCYLISLDDETLEHAKYYIENVPERIGAPYPHEIRKLGWADL